MSNQEKVKQLKDKGNAALKAGRHQKAIKYYSLAINLDPTNHVLYSIRGAAHCKAGNNRKAAADVKKSVSLNSAWVKTYSRKGDALAQLRKYKDALNVYREGLKFYPNNQQLKDGIKEVQVQMSQSQFTSGFPNPFCGKRNFFEKLKNDPRTKDCFNDPNYLKLLSDLQSNLQSMLTNMKDPRAMTTLNVLLGIDLFDATGAGNNVEVDTPSKPELSKSPEVELSKSPEVELSDENKKKPYSEVQVFEPLSVIDKQWELIDPHPDINLLLQEFDKRFFEGKLKSVEVKWDEEMTWCAGECSYKGGCSIRLSAPLHKFRPRKDLVETLLHEMIHAYVFISGIKETDDHGPQFLTHMARINEESGANVTVYHDFLNEVDYYRPYSWKCNGPCKNKYPHYGVIHRAVNRPPGPEDKWWSEHQIKCGGTFVKRKKHVTASGKDKVSAVTKKKYSNKVSAIAKRKYSIPVPKFGILTKRISAEWNQVYQIGAGLTNLGNSCFMNSVIQCLTYCPPLANYLFHNDHHISKCALTGFCLMCLLQNHMEKVMGKSGEVVKPLDIYQRLILLSKHFHLGRQEDAHEFLRCFIYHLWQSCSTDYNGVKSDFTTTEMTIIHQIFGGFHRSEVICLSCKEKSCEFFYCTDVMLDIDGDIASLENALAKFIEPASLQQENSYQCPFCEMKVKAQKTLTFFQPPVTAIFVLKRYSY